MQLRKYGLPPYRVIVEHGGPGAAGEMMPVAKQLAKHHGVLEPLHAASTVEGQCQELNTLLEESGDLPCLLIGHSWGAMLSFIFCACQPEKISKLILVSSGPFEESYALNLMDKIFDKCTPQEKLLFSQLLKELDTSEDKDRVFAQLGALSTKIDTYSPLSPEVEDVRISYSIYSKVWAEARELRKSGRLLQLGRKIQCPVVAIHGDYDSHPTEGVRKPLSRVLHDFRFIGVASEKGKNCTLRTGQWPKP
jgi:pimeloyl-ACP methyl ester carboxylesterase